MSLKRKASAIVAADPKKPKGNGSIASFFGTPKTVSSTTSAPVDTKWDKEAWVKKLSEEQRQLLALEIGTLHESWLKELRDEITSQSFMELKRFLKTEAQAGKKIFPPSADVYSWFVPFSLVFSTPRLTRNLKGHSIHPLILSRL